MRTELSSYPPATHILRPEMPDRHLSGLEKVFRVLTAGPVRHMRAHKIHFRGIVSLIKQHGHSLEKKNDEELDEIAGNLRTKLQKQGFTDHLVASTFALVREVAGRALGMRHFDCQLVGGLVLLKGLAAEMDTGEGKTLTATLAASTAALAGVPVHIISVNDYLTARDAKEMGQIYRGLGLTVGCVTHELSQEQRRAAYLCDITYCTNKEIVFDYLRDRILLGDCVDPIHLQTEHLYSNRDRMGSVCLRGLHFGIVDEADSILIDEARTPLLISKKVADEEDNRFLEEALVIARSLQNGVDYTMKPGSRSIEFTSDGRVRIYEQARSFGPLWTGTVRREEIVRQALSALHLFKLNEHYMIRNNKVEIVDEFTGRVMPDRSWERGLHQLIELKEGCEVTKRQETQARISYQRFFRRYLHLAGMTGTAKEVAGELWAVYRLPVVRIPTNRPVRRTRYADRIFFQAEAKWQAVVQRVQELHEQGRPVLIGARTICASEHASRLLTEAGLEHQVLNARVEEEEAQIIARAGEYGRITIATNMAGRGTDIKLERRVAERHGLHVILTERHEAKRIDRQLIGRCGRQGDPGSFEAILSLDDPLIDAGHARTLAGLAQRVVHISPAAGMWMGRLAMRWAQKNIERIHERMRKEMLKYDEKQAELLSFSGRAK